MRDGSGFERAALQLLDARTVDEVADVIRSRGPQAAGVESMDLVVGPPAAPTPADEIIPLDVDGLDAHLLIRHRSDRSPRRLGLAVALVTRVLRQIVGIERSQRMIAYLHQLEQVSGVDLLRMDLDALLDVLPERITAAVDCEFARIFMLDDDRAVLVEVGSHGIVDPSPARTVEEGLTGRVMRAGGSVILHSIEDVDVVGILPPSVVTVAGVPLVLDGEIIGVLDVGASEGRRFDHEDLTLLELAADRVVTAIDRTRAFATERDRRLRSDVLAMLGLILQLTEPVGELAARVARMAVQRICDRCHITVRVDGDAEVTVFASQEQGDPIVVRSETAPAAPTGNAVARVALVGSSTHLGWISFEQDEGTFTAEARRLQDEVATRLAIAVELRMANERLRHTAAELQRSLLPGRLPAVDGADVAVAAWPATERVEVGGDFYDVVELGDDRWGVLVGDVSGKGIRAAAMTGIARHTARAAGRHGQGPVDVLRWIHHAFLTDMETTNTYCTAIFGLLERRGDRFVFTYSVGGHPRPIHARAAGPARYVGEGGTVLGLVEPIRLHQSTVTLEPGDTLVLYTDGVTDVPGDGAVTEEGLLDLVDELRATNPSAEGFVGALEAHLVTLYRGRRLDDTVVLAVRNVAADPGHNR